MKNIICACIWIFMLPALITSINLKLLYKINNISKEIKEYERENAYLKKKLAEKTTLLEIQKKAFAMGFNVAEPSTIIMLEEKNNLRLFAKNNIFTNLKNLFSIYKET
ncbi:MAG: hypothetical protein N2Z20_03570 [Elusimicrobiales bacterium]|nr:hypothetical protein [Elusimicrobiales bacterium]